jgi:hypothetical protein
VKKIHWEEVKVEMIPCKTDEESYDCILEELANILYDHLASSQTDSELKAAISSGSFIERTRAK